MGHNLAKSKMKKFLPLVFLAIASVTVIMFACKKDNELQVNNTNPSQVVGQQNGEVIKRIVDFNKKVQLYHENPDMKSGERISIEEAKADIVDLFNVTYTEPMEYYAETEEHDFSITLPLTSDGKVMLDEVISAYEQAVEMARTAYHDSPMTDKGYVRLLVDAETSRDGNVRFDFNGKFGVKSATPPPSTPHCDGPFDDDDNWNYKLGLGKCDDETVEGGADQVLTDAIMEKVRSEWPKDPYKCRGFYTDILSRDFCGSLNSNLFYREASEGTCISWEYMNDYFAGEIQFIYNVIPSANDISLEYNLATNSRYVVIDVEVKGESNTVEEKYFYYHETTVEYGLYNYIENSVIQHQDL